MDEGLTTDLKGLHTVHRPAAQGLFPTSLYHTKAIFQNLMIISTDVISLNSRAGSCVFVDFYTNTTHPFCVNSFFFLENGSKPN